MTRYHGRYSIDNFSHVKGVRDKPLAGESPAFPAAFVSPLA
ncbi:hypothetical protein H074_08251 [Amycolatopsis decaplanina DSM 44594]|uniref:Uncharacterized protein n=1 Tax=Amycolatopsis decaplanina DSM 44594 TaxID=1284240 RepID=M2YLH0_9PSEU|nr:hypothetical protein H074_08251 [Amycolatopsis decaplanina DSM 44594]